MDYLKNFKKYEIVGVRMFYGILLGGLFGIGKMLLVKVIVGEVNVFFYFIFVLNFVEMFVGLGVKRVRIVVDEVCKNVFVIIFIDEFDVIGRIRGLGIGGGYDECE